MGAKQPKRVSRTMYCYSLDMQPRPEVQRFTWRDLFSRFTGVRLSNVKPLDETTALLLVVENLTDQEVRGHFSRLRDEWPRVLDLVDGRESHLPLAATQNVIERAHFIYYPERNIMVAEYNHYGVRAFGRFGFYVTDLVPELEYCELTPFVRYDALQEAARRKGQFRKFSLTITPPALPIIEEALQLGVDETIGGAENVDAELVIRVELSGGKKLLPQETQRGLGRLIDAFRTRLDRSHVKKAKVTADELIDLLGGEYFGKATVMSVDENTRVVRDSEMYDALSRFYHDHVVVDLPKLRLKGR